MLSVYSKDGFLPIETRQEYYYEMNRSGFHRLFFDVSVKDDIQKYLKNEAIIKNEDNRFLIKDINKRTQNITLTCELDMDDWKETIVFDTVNDSRFQTKTLSDILNVIKPSEWTISNADIRTIKRTPELKDVTPYDILVSLQEIYSVVYDINVLNKTICIVDPDSFVYDGLYATPELNMKQALWQGSSKDFCTKLFAYGKTDDSGNTTNIASVNGGKEYIENHTYTDRVVTLVWRDERYTDPQSLLDEAKKKLNMLCVPKLSYDISIYDLSKMNKEYDFLQFGLHKIVKTMIDENITISQRVVTYKKYYDKPDKNIITLSNEQQKFTSKVSSLLGGSTNDVIHGSFLEQAKNESTELINAFAAKGHKFETENEIYFLDKLPKEQAKYVMRINLGGIGFSSNGWAGPYTTAWTIDGKFNADFISTGTLNAIKIDAAIITGGSINIQNKFIVDGKGKLKCIDGEFSGKITASTFYGGDINGTNINTDKDIVVGNNIFVGGRHTPNQSINKCISFSNESYMGAYEREGNDTFQINSYDMWLLSTDGSESSELMMSPAQISLLTGVASIMAEDIFMSSQPEITSDIRLKENIKSIDLTGIFDYLNVYEFNYLYAKNNKTVGVIAQDFVGTPYEELILKKDKHGIYSVDYNVINMAVVQMLKKILQKEGKT